MEQEALGEKEASRGRRLAWSVPPLVVVSYPHTLQASTFQQRRAAGQKMR